MIALEATEILCGTLKSDKLGAADRALWGHFVWKSQLRCPLIIVKSSQFFIPNFRFTSELILYGAQIQTIFTSNSKLTDM